MDTKLARVTSWPAAHTNWLPKRALYLELLLLLSSTGCTVWAGAQQQGDAAAVAANKRLPDLASGTSGEPIVAVVGQDAFLSCVAKNLQNYTVIWRFTNEAGAPTSAQEPAGEELGSMLSAGRLRVSADERFSVIQSHDTWLLKISNVQLADTGTYICHTNSEPRVRALRILSVVKPGGQLDTVDSKLDHFADVEHNFTDCCRAEYVAPRCQRLCSFQQLASRYQSINIVHECYSALPSITRCMVAGRNVTDCCQKRHIPARCNAMCGHLGDTSAMSVQDQSYCADYSASIMSCVAEGISTLPGQPELVIVEAVSSSTLKVSWQKVTDESELGKIDGWIINLTKLSSFEDGVSSPAPAALKPPSQAPSSSSSSTSTSAGSSPAQNRQPLASLTIVDVMNNSSLAAMTKLLAASSGTISLKLPKHNNEFSIDNLKPYTVYQIQMFAYNSLGRSQLTDPIRALTLAPESELSAHSTPSSDAYVEPNLPDTRKCCVDRGVTLKRCLDTLCDPVEADRATIADLMICAPWSNVTFSCLSSRVNHTECCRSRGVSPFCLSMCSGDVKRVDYRHFRCLAHMGTYTNCILESHNVLPSAPLNFTVGPITHSWAVLNWRPPRKHARSLQGYRIFWRRVEVPLSSGAASGPANRSGGPSAALMGEPSADDQFFYASAEAATNPYLLDALQADTVYETFVVAVNRFGQSEPSVRFTFQTLADPESVLSATGAAPAGELESRLPVNQQTGQSSFYNESACCQNSGVHNACQQLCDYDLKVSDVSSLITTCSGQMPVILRCMAGNRNSVPCCRSRAVSDQCVNVCAGLTEHSPLVVATRCAGDFGKMIRCMDEGSKLIPSAPIDLHTAEVKPDRLTIKWKPAPEDVLRSGVEYHVRYQQLQQPSDQPLSADELSSLIAVVPLHPLEHNLILSTNQTEASIDKLRPSSRYSIYVTAENGYGISLPSLVLVVQTPDEDLSDPSRLQEFKRRGTLGAPHSLEILRSDTESILLKWIAPLFISNDAQIRYRVFFKLLQQPATSAGGSEQTDGAGAVTQLSSNWTILETSDTSLTLRNLRYSSQYAITVQAVSRQLLGHMSEILLASTAKPVPPALNHPLVINNPVEGNNVTIMCVALGQPTPQISMFINGLLVQKRTQPYVIYHLVNLARGHMTITCFASNGHGKDYASVQSRTEIDVKFPAKSSARTREVRANAQSSARLTCELSGNPQPTVVWTFSPAGSGDSKRSTTTQVLTPSDRVTTLLVSQFDSPFTWSHTLTLRNVSQDDAGIYHCRSRNTLAESADSIQLTVLSAGQPEAVGSATSRASYLKQVEQGSDLMQCCKSQGVSAKCLSACSADGLDVEAAFNSTECQEQLDKLMYCAADGSDHRNCCRTRQVPSFCLRWCSGAKYNMSAQCLLSSAIDINQCFQEGRTLLPGAPRNLRVLLASESEHSEQALNPSLSDVATTTTSSNLLAIDKLTQSGNSDTVSNGNNSSVIGSMVMMMGDQSATTGGQSAPTDTANPDQTDQQHSEPLVIEWDPPAKNPSLVQYYRIFWRPFGSRELSRTVTNLTWIKLNDLNINKNYEFVVKAANAHGSSVYSDPLTVKPAEVLAQSNAIGNAGLIWFMPSSGAGSLVGRVMLAIAFATLIMFSSLATVMLLERRGYLRRFASSKSNSSRISFANPAYLKDSDGTQSGDNITWNAGHSLDVLGPPAPAPSDESAEKL